MPDEIDKWNNTQHGKRNRPRIEANQDQHDACFEVRDAKGTKQTKLIACRARREIEDGDVLCGIIQHNRVHESSQQVITAQDDCDD